MYKNSVKFQGGFHFKHRNASFNELRKGRKAEEQSERNIFSSTVRGKRSVELLSDTTYFFMDNFVGIIWPRLAMPLSLQYIGEAQSNKIKDRFTDTKKKKTYFVKLKPKNMKCISNRTISKPITLLVYIF